MLYVDTPGWHPHPHLMDDLSQLRQAISGNHDALASLLARHGPPVCAALAINPKWQSVVSPEDVMQVTYLEAFLRISDFQISGAPHTAFAAWLRRIADNNLRDAVKEQQRAKRPQPDMRVTGPNDRSYVELVELLARDAPGGTPSGQVAAREAAAAIEEELTRLPEDYEQVIRLYELRGLSIADTARELNRTEGSIKMLLARARDRLREGLGSRSRFFSR